MKTIQIIHTGGTIAMTKNQENNSVSTQNQNPLPSLNGILKQQAKIRVDEYWNLPSPHITPQLMFELAQKIKHYIKKENIDGLVVTHGTDTLEETAYFLDLVLPKSKPIVITGAMRSSDEISADGAMNLLQAVRTATSEQARNKGVLVVFNNEIHAAKYVTKTHASKLDTFRSPEHGPLGYITKERVSFHYELLGDEYYPVTSLSKNVLLIKAVAGLEIDWLTELPHDILHGLVIEALGQGNLPPATVPHLKRILSQGIPVVLVSRCLMGAVEPHYDYAGGGKQLEELGVIFSSGINGQKARLKLMIALEKSANLDEIRDFFA